MKTLTFSAMIFLPGSFVSALFSVGFFDWNADSSSSKLSVSVRPGFILYWAVTVPLTVLVIGLYNLWSLYYKRIEKKLDELAAEDIVHPPGAREVAILARKRRYL